LGKPLVSICIPNYNTEKYLDVCIQSALNQTYNNIEVIFADDCSTDRSYSVAEKYSNQVKIYKNEKNIGQPENTNKCIKLSSGEFFVILHSDDQLLPEFIEKLLPIMINNPEVGIAVGERRETDETGVPISITPFYDNNYIIPGEKQAKVFLMMSFLPCQVLVRRTVFEKANGINPRHVVNLDGLLWFTLSLHADVAYIRDEVSIYRKHGENTTAMYNRKIDHMIEYYSTLSEMFRLAKGRTYIEKYFDDAVKRVAVLTVRYCHDVFLEKNYDLVKRFLNLALVFDPGIIYDNNYRVLKFCAESVQNDPQVLYNKLFDSEIGLRKHSYSPPEGSLKLE